MEKDIQNVFILDDDDALRDAMRELFVSEGMNVKTFSSAEAFLGWDLWKLHGCAIIDIHMRGMTGLELLTELKARGSKLSIIIITGQGDVSKAVKALKAGAIDFIEKPFDPMTLVTLVRKSLSNVHQLQQTELDIKNSEARLATLSAREHEVMDLVVAGNANKAIAAKLGISARTVETHRANMMEKTGCENISSLVSLVLKLKNK
jgi:FixJ family two-component response regulator